MSEPVYVCDNGRDYMYHYSLGEPVQVEAPHLNGTTKPNQDHVSIHMHLEYQTTMHNLEVDDIGIASESNFCVQVFRVPRGNLMSDSKAVLEKEISNIIGLPQSLQGLVLESLMTLISTLSSYPENFYIHPVHVMVIAVMFADYEEDDPPEFVPAISSTIDALQTIDVMNLSDGEKRCSICMEEYEAGSEVITRMPCSHVYHRDCITEWLEISHLCPLCRFPMPH